MRALWVLVLVLVTFGSVVSMAHAEPDRGRASLVGLRTVKELQNINWDSAPGGHFFVHSITHNLGHTFSFKLQGAGILSSSDLGAAVGDSTGVLVLTIDVAPPSRGGEGAASATYVVSTRLALSRHLWSVSDGVPRQAMWADTWTDVSAASYSLEAIKDGALDTEANRLGMHFIHDWKAAHASAP